MFAWESNSDLESMVVSSLERSARAAIINKMWELGTVAGVALPSRDETLEGESQFGLRIEVNLTLVDSAGNVAAS
jgi:hypothetical protein